MKKQIQGIAVRSLRGSAIYLSEHEPFLPGNIAKRGVIGKISRKAISPLANLAKIWHFFTGIRFLFFSKLFKDRWSPGPVTDLSWLSPCQSVFLYIRTCCLRRLNYHLFS